MKEIEMTLKEGSKITILSKEIMRVDDTDDGCLITFFPKKIVVKESANQVMDKVYSRRR